MVGALFQLSLTFGVSLGLMAVGLRFSERVSGYLNLAHTLTLGVGMMATVVGSYILGSQPYFAAPIAFVVAGSFNAILFHLFFSKIEKRGASEALIGLMGLALILVGENVLNVLTGPMRQLFDSPLWCGPDTIPVSNMHLHFRDPAGLIIRPSLIAALTVLGLILYGLHRLEKTFTGIKIRAVSENERLSEVLGVNPVIVKTLAWFIAGGLGGVAGTFYPYVSKGCFGRNFSYVFLPVFAAALLFESDKPWKTALSGLFVGVLNINLVNWGQSNIGVWVGEYQFVLPLALLVTGIVRKSMRVSQRTP